MHPRTGQRPQAHLRRTGHPRKLTGLSAPMTIDTYISPPAAGAAGIAGAQINLYVQPQPQIFDAQEPTISADIACRRLAELSRSVTRHQPPGLASKVPDGSDPSTLAWPSPVPSSATTPSSAPGRPTLLVALVCPW